MYQENLRMHVDRGRSITDTSLDPPSFGMNGFKEYQTTLKGFFSVGNKYLR